MHCGSPLFLCSKFGSCWVMFWVMFMRHGWRKCRKHAGFKANENRGLKGSQFLYFRHSWQNFSRVRLPPDPFRNPARVAGSENFGSCFGSCFREKCIKILRHDISILLGEVGDLVLVGFFHHLGGFRPSAEKREV